MSVKKEKNDKPKKKVEKKEKEAKKEKKEKGVKKVKVSTKKTGMKKILLKKAEKNISMNIPKKNNEKKNILNVINNKKNHITLRNKQIEIKDEFENKLSTCITKCHLFDDGLVNKTSSEYHDYQNSLDDIILFSKTITKIEKDDIDVIMFHSANEDGLMAAYYIYTYFKNKKELLFIPTKPSSSPTQLNSRIMKSTNELRNKNLLITDLSFNKPNYDYLSKICKSIIIIDDHPQKNNILKDYSNVKYFIGDNKHSASIYTFKFFFPKENIPDNLIVIDNNDRKLQLSFINRELSRYYTVYNNFKIIHSPYIKMDMRKNSDFEIIDKMLFEVSDDYKYIVGKHYDEVCNNIKTQVAINSVKRKFCGHDVYILNYNDPVLYKMVSREMFSFAERKGDFIKFVVIYGYEFTANGYKILVSEKHTGGPPKYTSDLYDILNKYGRSHYRGGKVAKNILNFYYPHDKNHDIFDLIR
jgi:hypothetical protein